MNGNSLDFGTVVCGGQGRDALEQGRAEDNPREADSRGFRGISVAKPRAGIPKAQPRPRLFNPPQNLAGLGRQIPKFPNSRGIRGGFTQRLRADLEIWEEGKSPGIKPGFQPRPAKA